MITSKTAERTTFKLWSFAVTAWLGSCIKSTASVQNASCEVQRFLNLLQDSQNAPSCPCFLLQLQVQTVA